MKIHPCIFIKITRIFCKPMVHRIFSLITVPASVRDILLQVYGRFPLQCKGPGYSRLRHDASDQKGSEVNFGPFLFALTGTFHIPNAGSDKNYFFGENFISLIHKLLRDLKDILQEILFCFPVNNRLQPDFQVLPF